MDTSLIFQFRAVYESGTIARASEQLNMTSGALSRALKRLEIELDTPLFIQSGRNILPTDEGKKFYNLSHDIITAIENAKSSLKSNLFQEKVFRLSTFEVFSTHFMAWMIDQQKIDFPIMLFESTPGKIEQDILNNLADYGLTYIPELHPELDHMPIGQIKNNIFRAKSIKSNVELPFAIPITELGINHLQAKSLDGWPTDVHREVKYRFEMLETALDLASRGQCKILCPSFIVKIENQRLNEKFQLIEEFSKIKFPSFKVYAVKKKTSSESSEFKKLCKAVRQVLSL
jgi:DNA-binding transcriptional LysR family regulator